MITELKPDSISKLPRGQWLKLLQMMKESDDLESLIENYQEDFCTNIIQESFQSYVSRKLYGWWNKEGNKKKEIIVLIYNTILLVDLAPNLLTYQDLMLECQRKGWNLTEEDYYFYKAEVSPYDWRSFQRASVRLLKRYGV